MLTRYLPARPVPGGQRGQGLIEYAVFLLLVAVVAIVAFALMRRQIQGAFQNVISTLEGP